MTDTSTTPTGQSWLSRNDWVLAAVWLVFLVPPLFGILSADDRSAGAKLAATALVIAFAGVYVDGFRRQHQREQRAHVVSQPVDDHRFGFGTAGGGHFAALVVLTAILGLVAGVEAIGVVPFIIVFAVFHFPWPAMWAVLGAGLVVTISVPLLAGRLGDFWFLSIITAGVGGAAVVVRAFQGHQFDQAHLRTRLAISDERTRMARDVHDVLGHSLTAVILKVELCQRLLDDTGSSGTGDQERVQVCREQLAELESISRQALAEIRSTVGGLRTSNVSDEVTAARTVLADAGVDLLVTGEVTDIAEGHRSMLAWVVREAVTNIVRHARAKRCHIELAPAPGTVLLRVSDDGVGLGTSGDGNGLRGLRERVASAGGMLRIQSPTVDEAAGTAIEVTV